MAGALLWAGAASADGKRLPNKGGPAADDEFAALTSGRPVVNGCNGTRPAVLLAEPATWQAMLDGGLRTKPKKQDHPSLLEWPAIKGHVDVLRLLIDAGADAAHDDVVMAAACFGMRDTARLLVERGFDGKQAVITMQRYKNQVALDILRELGFT
jgi:hypothetical protein